VCGIAGIYRLGERPPGPAEQADDRARVARMLGTIEYRGPDDAGLESVGRATLGVRRLSILDVASGHQPLSDAAGRVWAMQNGEIYNFPALRRELAVRHAFRSHTDTEVLPYLWAEHGPALPSRLRGMFALAVYDSGTEQLFLARDALEAALLGAHR
jgi:asparagine synthase (glutamine-hydrolysing)